MFCKVVTFSSSAKRREMEFLQATRFKATYPVACLQGSVGRLGAQFIICTEGSPAQERNAVSRVQLGCGDCLGIYCSSHVDHSTG